MRRTAGDQQHTCDHDYGRERECATGERDVTSAQHWASLEEWQHRIVRQCYSADYGVMGCNRADTATFPPAQALHITFTPYAVQV